MIRQPSSDRPSYRDFVKSEEFGNIVRSLYRYDQNTGNFFSLKHTVRKKFNSDGSCVGAKTNGYRYYNVKSYSVPGHALAWLFAHGVYPDKIVDHVNGDRKDNRICNLRLVDRSGHATNRAASSLSRTGVKGVHFHKGAGRFRAQLEHLGRRIHVGYFDSIEQAKTAYDALSLNIHGSTSEAYRSFAP